MSDGREMDTPMINSDYRFQERSGRAWEADSTEFEVPAPYHRRTSAGMWACLATLTVGLAVSIAYGYAVLRQENVQLEQIPGIVKSLPAMSQQLANLENRLEFAGVSQRRLASEVRSLDVSSKASLEEMRQHSGQMVAQVRQSLLKDMDQRTAGLETQVALLASQRNADLQVLAQMKEQVLQARAEMEKAQKDYALELSALQERQGAERHELASLTGSLPTRQVSFAVEKNRQTIIVPGISFQLIKTDVHHQRFDGLIESTPGDKAISVQSQGVRNPVMFYPGDSVKGFLFVVTRVDDKEVYGYLLVPSDQVDQANSLSAADDHLQSASGASR